MDSEELRNICEIINNRFLEESQIAMTENYKGDSIEKPYIDTKEYIKESNKTQKLVIDLLLSLN